ncbi:MAG: DUF2851 family protein [Dehalococcoidia bacterium]
MRAVLPAAVGFSEEQLVHLWEGQRFPPEALATREGQLLQAVHRGRRGRGPGPDFRDAIIATADGRLLQGDVELHVRASDFRAHGHHLDPAYDGVVLHVVFRDDDGEETLLASGARAAVVALAPWVARRAADLEEWLSTVARWREPCHSALPRLGRDEVAAALDRMGDRRFAQKVTAFGRALRTTDSEQLLYGALLQAMGYGSDGAAFGALAARAPWSWLRQALLATPSGQRVEVAEALLLGAAGLLAPGGSRYGERLRRRWRATGGVASLPAHLWRASGARPANHPQRRMAGLARLLAGYAQQGLLTGLRQAVTATAGDPASLVAALTVAADGFWAGHLDLSGRPWQRAPALIGPGRAVEVATNAALPFLAAWSQAHGDWRLEEAALALYRRLPRPSPYGIVAFLEANLNDATLLRSARRQQALLYLLQSYCRRGGCGRCPLS